MKKKHKYENKKANSKKAVFIIILSVVSLTLIIVGACIFSRMFSSPFIAVPADDNYENAWQKLMPQIKAKTGLKRIDVRTYRNATDLENLLKTNNKMLWAEVPISNGMDFVSWQKEGLIRTLNYTELPRYNSLIYPLVRIAQTEKLEPTISIPTQRVAKDFEYPMLFLPFTFNPWLTVSCSGVDSSKADALVSVAAKSNEEALGAVGLAILFSNNTETQTIFDTLESIQNNKILQHSAHTFGQHDATSYLLDGKVKCAFIKYSEFASFSVEQLQKLIPAVLPLVQESQKKASNVITTTGILFPNNKLIDKYQKVFCEKLFSDSEFLYTATSERNVLPAYIDVPVVNSRASSAITSATNCTNYILPEMTVPVDATEKEKFFTEIASRLRTY